MGNFEERVIPLGKDTLLASLVGAIIAVFCGIILLWLADSTVYTPESVPKRRFGGFLLLIVGAIGAFPSLKKMLRTSPALIINDKGIFDDTRLSSVGLISWNNIIDITYIHQRKSKTLFNEEFNYKKGWLNITVRDRGQYLTGGHFIKRLAKRLEACRCGNHIYIPATLLKWDIDDLQDIIQRYLAHYRKLKA